MNRVDIPPELGRVFTVRQAKDAGLGRYRLLGADLRRPTKGARVHGEPDLVTHLAALNLVLPECVALSHTTALEVMGYPVPRPWRPGDPIHVTSAGSRKPVRRSGVVCHLRAGVPVTTHQGLRVVPSSHAWVQSATLVHHDWLVIMADAICRDRPDRLEQLRHMVAGATGQRGVATLRKAVAAARTGSQSVRETQFRLLFARAGFPEPKLNADVRDDGGGWLARPDFLWEETASGRGLAAEYDSDAHHQDIRQWHQDTLRDRLLREAGYTVVVLTNADYRRPGPVLDLIAHHLGIERR